MSVVAVRKTKDAIEIGADSIIVSGGTKGKSAKLFEVDDFIFGIVGYSLHCGLFKLFAQTHRPKEASVDAIVALMAEYVPWQEKITNTPGVSNSFIFVVEQKVFSFHEFDCREVESFAAIGAGEDFALAALYLGHSVEQAINAACEFSIYCTPPVKLLTVPITEGAK